MTNEWTPELQKRFMKFGNDCRTACSGMNPFIMTIDEMLEQAEVWHGRLMEPLHTRGDLTDEEVMRLAMFMVDVMDMDERGVAFNLDDPDYIEDWDELDEDIQGKIVHRYFYWQDAFDDFETFGFRKRADTIQESYQERAA